MATSILSQQAQPLHQSGEQLAAEAEYHHFAMIVLAILVALVALAIVSWLAMPNNLSDAGVQPMPVPTPHPSEMHQPGILP